MMSPRRFIILFSGKEGTSPLMRLLDNFEAVSVVHHVSGAGWEPFDRHNCGAMKQRDLRTCLDTIFGKSPVDMQQLNAIYEKTAPRALDAIDNSKITGFKMRFVAPYAPIVDRVAAFTPKALSPVFRRLRSFRFKRMMLDVFKEHDIVVFLAVRQDVLRWGLSKYHGDGTGRRGHLQFQVASGQVAPEQLNRISIDPKKLSTILDACDRSHANKRLLMNELRQHGVKVVPLRYEDFVQDKRAYFRNMFDALDVNIAETEIERAIGGGEYFRKVHSADISEFVQNHDEITSRFGDRFIAW